MKCKNFLCSVYSTQLKDCSIIDSFPDASTKDCEQRKAFNRLERAYKKGCFSNLEINKHGEVTTAAESFLNDQWEKEKA